MDNDMTAYRKLSLLMLAVFLLVYAVGGVFYTLQARWNIERELGSVMELAASLPAPTQLAPALVPQMRHLSPVSVGEAVSGTTRQLPDSFYRLTAEGMTARAVNGWQRDPADAIEGSW